jgi:NAD(P)H dehydrogenase (quinone)
VHTSVEVTLRLFEQKGEFMSKTVLIVHAHPAPGSLTRTLVDTAKAALTGMGHRVLESDLYGMSWKAVFDESDFLDRADHEKLSFVHESGHAFSTGTQTKDVEQEQAKLLEADAVIFQFPLWWFGFPAILKGWVDRVFAYGLAYGYKGAGNRHRYGEGAFAGKRALLSVTTGGPAADYSERGINGPIEQILFPITHGMLFFAGMEVLPTFTVYGTGKISESDVASAKLALEQRLARLFLDAPIPYRRQNDGDYPDGHELSTEVAPGVSGIVAHIRPTPDPLTATSNATEEHLIPSTRS